MFRLFIVVLLIALGAQIPSSFAQTVSTPPAGPSAFTAQQRREIVDILRQALRTDPTILRDAVTALQNDESERQDGAARAAIADQREELLRAPGDPFAGNANGDVTVVEFYDIRCPYCRRMLPVVAELLRRDRNVRIVYKDIPILGPASVVGARALLAAERQGGYFKLRDALMNGGGQLDEDTVKVAGKRVGLDVERLLRDMADPAIQARIDANLKLARVLTIQGTPAYIIGDQFLPGAIDITDLQKTIALARRK